jgi:glutamine amidotransferase
MCRLFGFRSVIPSQVHRSLLAAENALGVQSNLHPDGWGVAFYVDGSPHVTRSPLTALGDSLFHRLSGVVASQTVLAHVRRATRGDKTVFNCHPFQYGRWVFAHNGDVTPFEQVREALLAEVSPALRRFILGETDSEILFFIFLSQLAKSSPLRDDPPLELAISALRATVLRVREIADNADPTGASTLTLMATNGQTLVATQGGKELFLSTYKTRCSDRDTCSSLSAACEAPSTGKVNHLVLSSEPLLGENVWIPLSKGEIIGVNDSMQTRRAHLERASLPQYAPGSELGHAASDESGAV